MKKKTVLLIADPHISIPPRYYGGTERIVALLGSELVKKGFIVDLLAGNGSKRFNGKLLQHTAPGKSMKSRIFRKIFFQFLLLYACRRINVVINFGRVDYLWVLKFFRLPIISTFENPILQKEIEFLNTARNKRIRCVGISYDHVKDIISASPLKVIYNGVDTTKYLPKKEMSAERTYLAFLGRLTYNKGVDIAIRVARNAGMQLKLAGNISNEEGAEAFFKSEVEPQLGNGVEWIGPIRDDQKSEFLGNAYALLFPIRWPEPFGIVMIESMACGTPVIGLSKGSVDEVIDNGITGFICESEDEMEEAIRKIESIDRQQCYLQTKKRFGGEVMASKYIELISEITN